MTTVLHAAKAKAAQTYNAAADHFDDDALSFWSRYGQYTVDHLALPPGARILDVGCGSGASALPAAKAVGPDGRVIGVDLADQLLDLARTKAAAQDLGNVEFHTDDMTALDYPDGSFDAVISVFAIFFVPDMERQVAELWRMVRPGGKLAITTWGPRFLDPAVGFWWESVRWERPDLCAAFNPWDRITTPDALRQVLNDGGVPRAKIVAQEGNKVLRGPEDWWTIVLGSGLRWVVEQMDDAAVARLRDDNLRYIRDSRVKSVETNVIYATAIKPV